MRVLGAASTVGVKSYFRPERRGFRNRTPSPVLLYFDELDAGGRPNGSVRSNWLRFTKKGMDVFAFSASCASDFRYSRRK